MAKKPGTYTATVMALKSQVLGKYVIARAWGYSNDDYRVRHIELSDHPVMVSRSVKTARRLIGMLPVCAEEKLREEEARLHDAMQDLDREIAKNGPYIKFNADRVERFKKRAEEMRAILHAPIDVVEVVSITTVTERVVP